MLPKLEEFDYKVDVDSNMAHKSLDRFTEELFEVLEARVKAYRYLWEESDWDVFTFVVTGTDRLMHFLWEAYEDEDHDYHSEFTEFFSEVDDAIGEIRSRLGPEDSLTIVSDHGFGPVHTSANVNSYLKEGRIPERKFRRYREEKPECDKGGIRRLCPGPGSGIPQYGIKIPKRKRLGKPKQRANGRAGRILFGL